MLQGWEGQTTLKTPAGARTRSVSGSPPLGGSLLRLSLSALNEHATPVAIMYGVAMAP